MANSIKFFLIFALIISFIILSIILFVKRNKIISKYEVGYVSSFFFAAYMLTPLFAGFSALISSDSMSNTGTPFGVFFIYPIVGFLIFLYVNRDMPREQKFGKFFAMIGIGICAAYIFVFKFLKIIHLFESDSYSSSQSVQKNGPIPNTYNGNDIFRGRINEYGEIYDFGGTLIARIKDNDIYYPNGNFYAHIDYSGDVYDVNGNYLGRIKDGEIQGKNWQCTGKLYDE